MTSITTNSFRTLQLGEELSLSQEHQRKDPPICAPDLIDNGFSDGSRGEVKILFIGEKHDEIAEIRELKKPETLSVLQKHNVKICFFESNPNDFIKNENNLLNAKGALIKTKRDALDAFNETSDIQLAEKYLEAVLFDGGYILSDAMMDERLSMFMEYKNIGIKIVSVDINNESSLLNECDRLNYRDEGMSQVIVANLKYLKADEKAIFIVGAKHLVGMECYADLQTKPLPERVDTKIDATVAGVYLNINNDNNPVEIDASIEISNAFPEILLQNSKSPDLYQEARAVAKEFNGLFKSKDISLNDKAFDKAQLGTLFRESECYKHLLARVPNRLKEKFENELSKLIDRQYYLHDAKLNTKSDLVDVTTKQPSLIQSMIEKPMILNDQVTYDTFKALLNFISPTLDLLTVPASTIEKDY